MYREIKKRRELKGEENRRFNQPSLWKLRRLENIYRSGFETAFKNSCFFFGGILGHSQEKITKVNLSALDLVKKLHSVHKARV